MNVMPPAAHTRLLTRVDEPPAATVAPDAIVVPTGRAVTHLADAFTLAEQLGCPLIVLCSRRSSAAQVVRQARGTAAHVIAANLARPAPTEDFLSASVLAGSPLASGTDTHLKRNVGLAVAHMLGWTRLLFLDDDVEIAHSADILAAAALVDRYAAVGLANDGFPGDSVVCQGYRELGGHVEAYIGGGALVVPGAASASFFPGIYHDARFYLLNDVGLNHVAITPAVTHQWYDPFADPHQAGSEEFGDCLAEGVYWLLHQGRGIPDADAMFWRDFLAGRGEFIDSIIAGIPDLPVEPAQRRRMAAALVAARTSRARISPRMCLDYLDAWRADRPRWRSFLRVLPRVKTPVDALRRLGMRPLLGGTAE